jgi:fructose-bisphosphate aldolase class 1
MAFRYQHLQKINQTYFQHLQNAFSYAAQCQKASLYFMVHAIYPDVFVDNGSTMVRCLNDVLQKSAKYNSEKTTK